MSHTPHSVKERYSSRLQPRLEEGEAVSSEGRREPVKEQWRGGGGGLWGGGPPA